MMAGDMPDRPCVTAPTSVAVVGSCVTYQALRAGGIPKAQLAANYARTSLASLTPPSASCPVIRPTILNESWDLISSGVGRACGLADARRIPRISEEAGLLWEAGLLAEPLSLYPGLL